MTLACLWIVQCDVAGLLRPPDNEAAFVRLFELALFPSEKL